MQKSKIELFSETLSVSVADQGSGRAFLLLHGGMGPQSMTGLAETLAKTARVIAPTHPGFNGQNRPNWFARIDDMALAYLALIERLNLTIASEMALRHSPRIAGIILLNAVGIDTGSTSCIIVDPMAVPPAERAALAFYSPKDFAIIPSSPEAIATMVNNQNTLRVYAGNPFKHDPTLRSRLADMVVPAMVAWGESDGIVDQQYGRLFASSIPNARFELVRKAGHFPQIEQRDEVVQLITEFTSGL